MKTAREKHWTSFRKLKMKEEFFIRTSRKKRIFLREKERKQKTSASRTIGIKHSESSVVKKRNPISS